MCEAQSNTFALVYVLYPPLTRPIGMESNGGSLIVKLTFGYREAPNNDNYYEDKRQAHPAAHSLKAYYHSWLADMVV